MTHRVHLRPVRSSDLAHIEPWYAEAASASYAEGSLEKRVADARDAGCGLLGITGADGDILGLLDYRAAEPAEGWVTTVLIAMAAGQRGRGYGSEAMHELQSRYPSNRFLAPIDARNGLAVYFWLRLGYRPASPHDSFWRGPERDGIIAMVRLPQDKE